MDPFWAFSLRQAFVANAKRYVGAALAANFLSVRG
jgi:hypothetical protein